MHELETKDVQAFLLRLPHALHRQLQELAAQQQRSLQGQILYILQQFTQDNATCQQTRKQRKAR